jgi:vacuolar-type H+-ATPase subunit E/Vma4
MKAVGSVAAVIAAIREDAAAEAEAIESRATAEVERIRGLQASDVVTIPDRESRLAAARRHAQMRVAQEDWEDTRDAVAVREEWMNRALELGRQVLTNREGGQAHRERLAALVAEGLARLPGGACEIVLSGTDVALLGPDWGRDTARVNGRDDIRVTAGSLDGGCILRTLDGRLSFDNSYTARTNRFQAAWRSALARVYEQAISTAKSDERGE